MEKVLFFFQESSKSFSRDSVSVTVVSLNVSFNAHAATPSIH